MANVIMVSENYAKMCEEAQEFWKNRPVKESEMLYTKEERKKRSEHLAKCMKVWNEEPKKKR